MRLHHRSLLKRTRSKIEVAEVSMKEYQAIKVKWDVKLEEINKVMNDMAKDGWDVVCMSPEPPHSTMNFVVTFCREKSE